MKNLSYPSWLQIDGIKLRRPGTLVEMPGLRPHQRRGMRGQRRLAGVNMNWRKPRCRFDANQARPVSARPSGVVGTGV